MRWASLAAVALAACTPPHQVQPTETPTLIPRAALFGNPRVTGLQISPDGSWLSWHAPRDGVLNLWVAPSDAPEQATALTDASRPILESEWAFDGQHLLYWQDEAGEENEHVYRVDVRTGEVTDLTPLDDVRAGGLWQSPNQPGRVIVELNERDPDRFDLFSIDLHTAARTLVLQNDPGFQEWLFGPDLEPRLGLRLDDRGGLEWMERRDNAWQHFHETPPSDVPTLGLVGFSASGRSFYTLDAEGRDTVGLFEVDMDTKTRTLVHADDRADLGGWHQTQLGPRLLVHPTTQAVQAVVVDFDRPRWKVLDHSIEGDFAGLAALDPGVPWITSRTLDDGTWIVAFQSDVRSARYYRWDRTTQQGTLLFVQRPELDGHPLRPMQTHTVEARDGLPLVAYLTLPDEAERGPVPMVLLVHGGPWYRDRWGFDVLHQLLADRGYAALSLQFRGSTGFGKRFMQASKGQWGRAMQDDLIDAVKWAVRRGIAQEDAVCIGGYSYGGYATLTALSRDPEVFACGVDIVGPADLVVEMQSLPTYWPASTLRMMLEWVGDPSTADGRQHLRDISPLTHADAITKPLLIAEGGNDVRVKDTGTEQLVSTLRSHGVPVRRLVFSDEGHFFVRPENNRALFGEIEAFLATHLGGRAQPLDPAELAASSIRDVSTPAPPPSTP